MDEPGILRNVIYFITFGFYAFLVLFAIELRLHEKFYNLIKKTLEKPQQPSTIQGYNEIPICDDDVQEENDKINGLQPVQYEHYNLLMKNISKHYDDFLAVNQVCLGIQPYECFGLLG